ncbi:MAG: hypothetical protein LBS01_03535 [Prevotellaceae bacterium]|jgi:hypothetical protein|nr:hypothetical protein [Prevotellaceae bacterium]
MKNIFLFLMILCMSVFVNTYAQNTDISSFEPVVKEKSGCINLSVPLVGKAGATISSSGKTKICPGWAWNICARVTVTLFYEKPVGNIDTMLSYDNAMDVEFFDEAGNLTHSEMRYGKITVPYALNSKESLYIITEDDIELE